MNSNQENFQSSSKKAWCQPTVVVLAVQSTAMPLAYYIKNTPAPEATHASGYSAGLTPIPPTATGPIFPTPPTGS